MAERGEVTLTSATGKQRRDHVPKALIEIFSGEWMERNRTEIRWNGEETGQTHGHWPHATSDSCVFMVPS